MFDADSFLQTDIEGASSTKVTPVPLGEWPAVIKSVAAKEVVSKKDGQTYRFLEIHHEITDQEVADITGRDKSLAKQSMLLDLSEDGSMLAMGEGKNVGLGRLREACGQNDPSQPWNFKMLEGQAVRVSIKHRTDETTGDVFSEVKGAIAL